VNVDVDTLADWTIRAATERKEGMVDDHGGPVWLPPTVVLFREERASVLVRASSTGSLPHVATVGASGFRSDAIAVSMDVLTDGANDGERGEGQQGAQQGLAGRFHAGDMTVCEAIVVIAVARGGRQIVQWFAPYSYDDTGRVQWDDDVSLPTLVEHEVVKSVAEAAETLHPFAVVRKIGVEPPGIVEPWAEEVMDLATRDVFESLGHEVFFEEQE
jgi:hypothetical protein